MDGFCLPEQSLGNREGLHAARVTDVIDVRVGEGLCALDEIVGVSSNVLPLCLDCLGLSELTYEIVGKGLIPSV